MDNFLRIFLCVVVVNIRSTRGDFNFCPKQCDCDLYKNFNRAQCRNQKLISPNIGVLKQVQILDLSENGITTLDNNCFEDLSNLLNLSLSYNSIHTIYLDAFRNLEKMQYIDLGYNRLEYFDDRIFENNFELVEINLAGNKFMSLQNKPLFISKSLKILSLRNCRITHLYTSFFDQMELLETLDLSDNLMITINIAPFSKLNTLKYVNLEVNRWNCDKNLETVIKLLKKRKVDIRLDVCNFNKQYSGPMFERMMIEKPTPQKSEVHNSNVWRTVNVLEKSKREGCPSENVYKICELYHNCLDNYTILMQKNYKNSSCTISNSINTVTFVFCAGLVIGCIGATCLICLTYLLCTKCTKSRKPQLIRRNAVRERNNRTIVRLRNQPTEVLLPPQPQTMSPVLNRSLSTPERRRFETNQSDFATFITRLFERPTRHQYYRAINQNTTNMIRRLSRSSLFLNASFKGQCNRLA